VRAVQKANLEQIEAFITLDGSSIRELAGPAWTAARAQSLAEATVAPDSETTEHYHPVSEELYYFVAGAGRMRLGGDEGEVLAGDCVVIPPGIPHKLWNPGPEPLVLLCCCSPAYSDDDTVMTGR
jgi:mannose-6-phosphate isomerase-like protein (cupin superfamily)